MIGIFLLVDVNEPGRFACVRLSASRGVNALARGVIPRVVNADDTFKLGDLLAAAFWSSNHQLER